MNLSQNLLQDDSCLLTASGDQTVSCDSFVFF